jgi:hypothetical protein
MKLKTTTTTTTNKQTNKQQHQQQKNARCYETVNLRKLTSIISQTISKHTFIDQYKLCNKTVSTINSNLFQPAG